MKICDCNRGIPSGPCGYCADCCIVRGKCSDENIELGVLLQEISKDEDSVRKLLEFVKTL